eukprot:COSAG02_NODE_40711_length_402_cov_0.851485_1_plen_89_part_10
MPENYRIKSINGTNVTDRNSIIQQVGKVATGEPIVFFLERSGGYSHNPLRGKENAGYHEHTFAVCDRFPLTWLLRAAAVENTHAEPTHV